MIIYRIYIQIKDFMVHTGYKWLAFILWVGCLSIFSFSSGVEAVKQHSNEHLVIKRGGMSSMPQYSLKPKEKGEESSVSGKFFASKNGKKYYPSTCTAGARIKTENKLYFETEEQAIARGYSKSSSC